MSLHVITLQREECQERIYLICLDDEIRANRFEELLNVCLL